jgi:hypothetical protein
VKWHTQRRYRNQSKCTYLESLKKKKICVLSTGKPGLLTHCDIIALPAMRGTEVCSSEMEHSELHKNDSTVITEVLLPSSFELQEYKTVTALRPVKHNTWLLL